MRCVGFTLTMAMRSNNELFIADDSSWMGRGTNMRKLHLVS
jgi:hypothetical protein